MTPDILADAVEALEQRVNASDRLLWALYIEAEEPPLTVQGYADKMLSVGVDTTLALARFREAREGKTEPSTERQALHDRLDRIFPSIEGFRAAIRRAGGPDYIAEPAPLDPVALDAAAEKAYYASGVGVDWERYANQAQWRRVAQAAVELYLRETGRGA